MTHWNYRVVRQVTESGAVVYEIRDFYYGDNGGLSWGVAPVAPYGETLEELDDDVRAIIRSLSEPVLDLDELEGAEAGAKVRARDDESGDARAD